MTRLNFHAWQPLLAVFALAAPLSVAPNPTWGVPVTGLNYYEDSSAMICTNATICSVKFTAIETEAMVLAELKCIISVTTTKVGGWDLLTLHMLGNGHSTYLLNNSVAEPSRGTGEKRFEISRAFLKVFRKENTPAVSVKIGGASRISMNCNIVGKLS